MKKSFFLFVCLIGICCSIGNGRAQGFLIDQQDAPPTSPSPPYFISFWTLAPSAFPIGQEFVPSFSSLDFVDLLTYDGANASGTATFQVIIHSDSIAGTIIGTSDPTARTDGSESITHFDFSSSVPLSAGDTYVLELAQTASDGTLWALGSDPLAAYANGQMIAEGVPQNTRDLWFDEGVTTVPEPKSSLLFLIGAAAFLFSKGCRRFSIRGRN